MIVIASPRLKKAASWRMEIEPEERNRRNRKGDGLLF